MEEGTIAKWLKKEGDSIHAGEVIVEIASDKATVEYEAIDNGVLRKILKKEGEEASVNDPIAVFSATKDESIDDYLKQFAEKKEADIARQANTSSESVEVKTTAKQTSNRSEGALQQPAFTPEAPLEGYRFEFPRERIQERVAASPLARRLAKEQGLDLTSVKGSGPAGRIIAEDLNRAQKEGIVNFGSREEPLLAPGTFEEQALTPMRKIVGQRLQESKTFIPHFYVTQKVDASALIDIREQLRHYGIKISFNDLVVRAAALALREHPGINSGFNSTNQSIIRFKTIDIAIAVSLEGGLITPIIRHADYKNLGELSTETRELAGKARSGKLQPHEYKGGSFTISNLGMYGVSEFSAVINPPHGAILAVSGILDTPVVKNGAVVAGKVMSLTLSSDHRVIDGVAAAEFLTTLKKFLETPAGLLI